MAHYVATVKSPWSQEKAFDYIADFRNVEQWDPGVSSSAMKGAEEPGTEASYLVKVATGPLMYRTLEFDRPGRTVLEATSSVFRSYDVIDVVADGEGSKITYDATLELSGFMRLADPLLSLVFGRVGDKAAAGMAKALDGEIVG